MTHAGKIANIVPGSIADEVGLEAGEELLKINGSLVTDIIDLSFHLADEYIKLLVKKNNGEQEVIEIEKDYDEELGIEFESAVFDGIKRCSNRCIFCFVDQMAPGLRSSLYVKDDDYRLSFLYGNFITLTNITANDMKRIKTYHLSPLYISVHTTDGALRAKMLNNDNAALIMKQLKQLTEMGVEVHTQVVLCPGINDGSVLEQTIKDLSSLSSNILSLAIVPVGLSKYRSRCYPLQPFSKEHSAQVVELVTKYQLKFRKERGVSFVYLADEFYISAAQEFPPYEWYDDFPQLENGVGLAQDFIQEWDSIKTELSKEQSSNSLGIVCGVSSERILKSLVEKSNIHRSNIQVIPVVNEFFGRHITVTGLLTGQDIINTVNCLQDKPQDGIIIPGVALRKGENIFLDNMTPDDISAATQLPVRIAHSGADLHQLLARWK